jgi:hypothetical protein
VEPIQPSSPAGPNVPAAGQPSPSPLPDHPEDVRKLSAPTMSGGTFEPMPIRKTSAPAMSNTPAAAARKPSSALAGGGGGGGGVGSSAIPRKNKAPEVKWLSAEEQRMAREGIDFRSKDDV